SDGTGEVRLSDTAATAGEFRSHSFEWARAGDLIVYTADAETSGVHDLHVSSGDGTVNRKLSTEAGTTGNVTRYRLAPDGSGVLYQRELVSNGKDALFLAGTDGSAPIRASPDAPDDVRTFEWSPAGVVYAVVIGHLNDTSLHLGDATGETEEVVSGKYVGSFQWSPGGSLIAWEVADTILSDPTLFASEAPPLAAKNEQLVLDPFQITDDVELFAAGDEDLFYVDGVNVVRRQWFAQGPGDPEVVAEDLTEGQIVAIEMIEMFLFVDSEVSGPNGEFSGLDAIQMEGEAGVDVLSLPGGDRIVGLPLVGDFDGDGVDDIEVWTPVDGGAHRITFTPRDGSPPFVQDHRLRFAGPDWFLENLTFPGQSVSGTAENVVFAEDPNDPFRPLVLQHANLLGADNVVGGTPGEWTMEITRDEAGVAHVEGVYKIRDDFFDLIGVDFDFPLPGE
ncbi:MAG: TolB-like translocation protein, partial [Planctomycetota bacterium]